MTLNTIHLEEWTVTFTMRAGKRARMFTLTVPATDEEGARAAAHGLAYAINEGSGHVWKITDEVSVQLVGAERR